MYDYDIGDIVIVNNESEGVVVDATVGIDAGWYKCKITKFYDIECAPRSVWVPFNFLKLKET